MQVSTFNSANDAAGDIPSGKSPFVRLVSEVIKDVALGVASTLVLVGMSAIGAKTADAQCLSQLSTEAHPPVICVEPSPAGGNNHQYFNTGSNMYEAVQSGDAGADDALFEYIQNNPYKNVAQVPASQKFDYEEWSGATSIGVLTINDEDFNVYGAIADGSDAMDLAISEDFPNPGSHEPDRPLAVGPSGPARRIAGGTPASTAADANCSIARGFGGGSMVYCTTSEDQIMIPTSALPKGAMPDETLKEWLAKNPKTPFLVVMPESKAAAYAKLAGTEPVGTTILFGTNEVAFGPANPGSEFYNAALSAIGGPVTGPVKPEASRIPQL